MKFILFLIITIVMQNKIVQEETHFVQKFDNINILIFKFKKDNYDFEIIKEKKIIQNFDNNLKNNEIIFNGAFFDKNNNPTGFLKIKNEIVGKNIYDKNVSGVFLSENGKIKIKNEFNKNKNYDFVMQSFPLLIKDGKINYWQNSKKLAKRTCIAEDYDNNFYVIIVYDNKISLYDFARAMKNNKIKFKNALNLDGGSSTGFCTKNKCYPSFVRIPFYVKILKK